MTVVLIALESRDQRPLLSSGKVGTVVVVTIGWTRLGVIRKTGLGVATLGLGMAIVIIDDWKLIIAEIGRCWGWSSSTACGMDGQRSSSSLELEVVVVVDGMRVVRGRRWWAKKLNMLM